MRKRSGRVCIWEGRPVTNPRPSPGCQTGRVWILWAHSMTDPAPVRAPTTCESRSEKMGLLQHLFCGVSCGVRVWCDRTATERRPRYFQQEALRDWRRKLRGWMFAGSQWVWQDVFLPFLLLKNIWSLHCNNPDPDFCKRFQRCGWAVASHHRHPAPVGSKQETTLKATALVRAAATG